MNYLLLHLLWPAIIFVQAINADSMSLHGSFDNDTQPTLPPQINDAISKICRRQTNEKISEASVVDFIFKNYSKSMRPLKNASESLEVTVGIVIDRIESISEKMGTITLSGYLIVRWFDENLKWDTKYLLYCVESINIPGEDVFKPDIVLLNSDEKYSLTLARGHRVTVKSNGEMSYFPSGSFSITCPFNLRNFPFDRQKCSIDLASWAYPREMQRFKLMQPKPLLLYNFTEAQQWKLLSTSANISTFYFADVNQTWELLQFTIQLQRKADYYVINIIIPSTIISIVEIVTFSLPLEKAMKVHISFTALLAYSVFQLMIISDIPRTSENPPLLSVYIDLSMAYIGGVLMGEGLVFSLLGRSQTAKVGPPVWLYRCVAAVCWILSIRPSSQLEDSLKKSAALRRQRPLLEKLFFTTTTTVANLSANLVGKRTNGEANKTGPGTSRSNGAAGGFTNTMEIPLAFMAPRPSAGRAEPKVAVKVDEEQAPQQHSSNGNDQSNDVARPVPQMPLARALPHNFEQLSPMDISEMWVMMARLSEALTLIMYALAIIVTPVVIFVIMPALEVPNEQ